MSGPIPGGGGQIRPGHVKVEWNTGQGYMGKTTMLSVNVLRKRLED